MKYNEIQGRPKTHKGHQEEMLSDGAICFRKASAKLPRGMLLTFSNLLKQPLPPTKNISALTSDLSMLLCFRHASAKLPPSFRELPPVR